MCKLASLSDWPRSPVSGPALEVECRTQGVGPPAPLPAQERIICLHGPITEQMSSLVTAQLLFLESEDPEKPVNMYINRLVIIIVKRSAFLEELLLVRLLCYYYCRVSLLLQQRYHKGTAKKKVRRDTPRSCCS